MIRQCPKCGKIFKGNRSRCNGYFPGGKRCETVTVEVVVQPPDSGPKLTEAEPELKEDEDGIIGRAGQIVDLIKSQGPMTYKQLAEKMGVTPKRVTRLVSQMFRDGLDIKRVGNPRRVYLGE